jgi:xylulokinase
MLFLGLDVGTTRCKAALFDEGGNSLGSASREYGYRSVVSGWAEQDPEEVWEAVLAVLLEVLRGAPQKPVALSVSAQGEAVIFLDEAGKVLRPAILGMDMRAQKESAELEAHFGKEWLLQTAGVPVHPLTSAAKILWVRHHEPDIFRRSRKILCYEDFLFLRLGGIPVIDHSMACKTMLFDRNAKRWSTEILAYLGLTEENLASCVPSGTVIGTIREDLASILGLSEDLKLVAGGHDQCCAALGAGSTQETVAFDNAGTAEVFGIPVMDKAVVLRIHPLTFSCYSHVLPGKFLLATLNQTAGLFLRWYRDTLGKCLVEREKDRDPYAVLMERVSPKPASVLALPHLVGSGTPWIDAASKAAFVGMTLATGEGDILRAILEGVVFEQKISVDLFEAQGITFEEIRVTGGCSRSPLWLQIRADIFGKAVKTLEYEDASVLGAAILAAVGEGVYASPEEAAKEMVRVKSVFEPQEENRRIYQEKFPLYRELYFALREIHHQMV